MKNGLNWLEKVFKESPSRISQAEFYGIIACFEIDDYKSDLNYLFWDEGEAHNASSRREDFLPHLSLTEYSRTYNTILRHKPDPTWVFVLIMEEIRMYGDFANKVMMHVALWYNPNIRGPSPRQSIKDPIHVYLKEPLKTILPERPHPNVGDGWKPKALSLQQIVIDFAKRNGSKRKAPFLIGTLRFNQPAELYHERFIEGNFWDRLAREIHRRMPEIPFQHPDLLQYNNTSDDIYHPNQRPTLGTASPAHPKEDVLSIADQATREGDVVAPEIEDLIGQEYGSDTPSIQEISDPGRRASTSAGHEQTSSASSPTSHLAPGTDNQRQFVEGGETVGVETEYYDSSSTPPSTLTGLGKRKSSNARHTYQFTTGGRQKSKIIKLELSETVSSASDSSQTLKNGRRDVYIFREQVRRQSLSPPRGVVEPSPSVSIATNERASNPALMSNGRKQTLIDPIPPPRRRKMMTNLPDDLYAASPPPSTIASAANRREFVHSTAQSPALTAPPAPMFSASQETAPITPRGPPLAEPPLSEVKQAVQIVLNEFVDNLNLKEQVAAINAVRRENSAAVFVMLPSQLRKAWLYNEIGSIYE